MILAARQDDGVARACGFDAVAKQEMRGAFEDVVNLVLMFVDMRRGTRCARWDGAVEEGHAARHVGAGDDLRNRVQREGDCALTFGGNDFGSVAHGGGSCIGEG